MDGGGAGCGLRLSRTLAGAVAAGLGVARTVAGAYSALGRAVRHALRDCGEPPSGAACRCGLAGRAETLGIVTRWGRDSGGARSPPSMEFGRAGEALQSGSRLRIAGTLAASIADRAGVDQWGWFRPVVGPRVGADIAAAKLRRRSDASFRSAAALAGDATVVREVGDGRKGTPGRLWSGRDSERTKDATGGRVVVLEALPVVEGRGLL